MLSATLAPACDCANAPGGAASATDNNAARNRFGRIARSVTKSESDARRSD
jgi:hypothetical protein